MKPLEKYNDELPNDDPRYFAIDKHGAGSKCIAITQKCGSTFSNFGIPSMPGLLLKLAQEVGLDSKKLTADVLFKKTDQGLTAEDHGPLFDFFEKRILHIVASFTALESFANNEIPSDFKYIRKTKRGKEETLGKEEIERRLGLNEKFDKILPQILKLSSPAGTELWTKYNVLKDLRDRIIHLKSEDTKSGGPETERIWGSILADRDSDHALTAHEMILHFRSNGHKSRWIRLFPYAE